MLLAQGLAQRRDAILAILDLAHAGTLPPRRRQGKPGTRLLRFARNDGASLRGARQRRNLVHALGGRPMGMTIIEKILARADGTAKIGPGDLAIVDVDLCVLIDLSFSPSSWREVLKVHDPEKVVVVFAPDVPASNRETAAMHVRGRDFVRRFGIRRFHDVGPDQGISHVVVAENAYCLPGTVMACSDSHTCSAGALNCADRGLGAPDLLYALTTGKTWFRVGETIRYDLEGRLAAGVSTKDLFLHIAGTYGDHANQNVEFGGSALPHFSFDARRHPTHMFRKRLI